MEESNNDSKETLFIVKQIRETQLEHGAVLVSVRDIAKTMPQLVSVIRQFLLAFCFFGSLALVLQARASFAGRGFGGEVSINQDKSAKTN